MHVASKEVTSFVVREMQMNTTMRYYSSLLEQLKSERLAISDVGKNIGTRRMFEQCWWECKMIELSWRTGLAVLIKLDLHLLHGPPSSLLDPYVREMKTYAHRKTHENVHSSFVHDGPNLESTQAPSAEDG